MLNYIIRRLLILPFILIGVTILVFAMLSMLTPYERASLYVSDIPKRQGSIEDIVEKYGLNDPIHIQYWRWMVGQEDEVSGEVEGGILRGDMGFSTVGHMPVAEIIKHRLPATAELALLAAIPLIGLSVWMGIKSAVHHNKLTDQILRVFHYWLVYSDLCFRAFAANVFLRQIRLVSTRTTFSLGIANCTIW